MADCGEGIEGREEVWMGDGIGEREGMFLLLLLLWWWWW